VPLTKNGPNRLGFGYDVAMRRRTSGVRAPAHSRFGRYGPVLVLAVISGCTLTTTASSTTLAPLPIVVNATTTTTLALRKADIEGFAGAVRDGRTFDFQVGPASRIVTLAHITVADAATCEGSQAKELLQAIIVGHKLRLDSEGIVWRDDLDVAQAMVSYGMATASDGRYAGADAASADVNCTTTPSTSTTHPVVTSRPRPTVPRPRPTNATTPPTRTQPAAVDTEPVAATGSPPAADAATPTPPP